MIYLSPVEPSAINPFTLSNDMNVLLWHSLLKKMNKAKKTLVVTGAGISVEAGIPVKFSLFIIRTLDLNKAYII
jgi:hypothetical protein